VFQDLLKDETVIVTGAAQGNGRAIALGLARCGAKLAIADLNGAGAAETAREIEGLSGTAYSAALDVVDIDACMKFAHEVEERLGAASVLINNAGIIRRTAFDDKAFLTDLDMTLSINVKGSVNMTTAFLQQLRSTQGRIINLGSIMSFVGASKNVSYAASKGAVLQLTKALAAELAPDGIRVNGIAPGVISTPMTEVTRSTPEALARFMNHTPLGRVGEPDELIGPILFLASKMSSYVTGAMLPIDGGYLAV
jgi:NAD(P)-dependent dehydrogenase (short-subunit alcohol dehydrogenase family)